ncbi:MAG: hypothetical protein DHS20C13_30540 [Thermodesulfobacteriota bacterium]|nr:MAG: hypothetical protein DHS20C13_30540 [Thermodesulfobacteriota bacterium]
MIYVYYAYVVNNSNDMDQYPLMVGAVYLLLNMVHSQNMTVMVNPARFVAAALFNLKFNYTYIYLLSPCFGAISAAYLFEKIYLKNQKIH